MTFKVSNDSNNANNLIRQKQNQPSFKGLESAATYLATAVQTKPIVEYTAVDLGSMIIPRTAIDFTRGPAAGMETMRRENSALANNCLLPGIVAAGVGIALGKYIDKDIKVKSSMPINTDTIKLAHNAWKTSVEYHKQNSSNATQEQILHDMYQHIFDNTTGVVGEKIESFKDASRTTTEVHPKTIAQRLTELTMEKINLNTKASDYKTKEKELNEKLKGIINHSVEHLGASESLFIDKDLNDKLLFEKTHRPSQNSSLKVATKTMSPDSLVITMEHLIDNLHNLGKEVFHGATPEEAAKKVEKLGKVNKNKAIATLALMCTSGLSLQYFNRYLTKKKTGSDAFVGIAAEHQEKPDPNAKSKLRFWKGVSVAGMLALMATTVTGKIKPGEVLKELKGNKLLKKLEFNSLFPNSNQLKVIYGTVIIGRMLAATDKHELRETDTRDFPGFLNWLVLGGVVSKFVGRKLYRTEKDGHGSSILLNYATQKPAKSEGALKRFVHFISNQKLVTHAEINARKMTEEEAKNILTKCKKAVPENGKEAVIEAKKLLRGKLNWAIGAGLAYSTVMLGIVVPMFNKHLTNNLAAKNKKQAEENKNHNIDKININRQNTPSALQDASPVVNNDLFYGFIKPKKQVAN
jgi:hypothetical protein